MVQQGKVISVDGEYATVEIIRESACSSCHNKDSCGASVIAGCAKKERMEVIARNTAGASVGQGVELTSDSAKTLGIAFCVFVLPIILSMLGYFVASLLSFSESVRIISAVCVFAASFLGLFFGFDGMLKGKVSIEVTSVTDNESASDL